MKIRWLTGILIPILILHLTGCTTARELSLPGGGDGGNEPHGSSGRSAIKV